MSKTKEGKIKKPNQKLRKGILFISLLLFPITMNYLSPYVIIESAMVGIINGSFILFVGLFISSLIVGRAFCAYVCPGGGLMEFGGMVHNKTCKGGRRNLIKWAIWIPWIGMIATFAIMAGGYTSINIFHLTESGISVDSPSGYIIYLTVVFSLLLITFIAGKRAGCHYVCWMAPFMILGTWIKNKVKYPSYHLEADTEKCTKCKMCSKNCPMSIDVTAMVQKGSMKNVECILCGNCVVTCRQGAIRTSWKWAMN